MYCSNKLLNQILKILPVKKYIKLILQLCGLQMNYLKNIIKNTPLISTIYSIFRNSDRTLRKKLNPLKKKSTEDIFTDIYKTNA